MVEIKNLQEKRLIIARHIIEPPNKYYHQINYYNLLKEFDIKPC